jgi:hypothetical protein
MNLDYNPVLRSFCSQATAGFHKESLHTNERQIAITLNLYPPASPGFERSQDAIAVTARLEATFDDSP